MATTSEPANNQMQFRIEGACWKEMTVVYEESDGHSLEISLDPRGLFWDCSGESFDRWHGVSEKIPPEKRTEIVRAFVRFGRKRGYRFRVRRRRLDDRFVDIRMLPCGWLIASRKGTETRYEPRLLPAKVTLWQRVWSWIRGH